MIKGTFRGTIWGKETRDKVFGQSRDECSESEASPRAAGEKVRLKEENDEKTRVGKACAALKFRRRFEDCLPFWGIFFGFPFYYQIPVHCKK